MSKNMYRLLSISVLLMSTSWAQMSATRTGTPNGAANKPHIGICSYSLHYNAAPIASPPFIDIYGAQKPFEITTEYPNKIMCEAQERLNCSRTQPTKAILGLIDDNNIWTKNATVTHIGWKYVCIPKDSGESTREAARKGTYQNRTYETTPAVEKDYSHIDDRGFSLNYTKTPGVYNPPTPLTGGQGIDPALLHQAGKQLIRLASSVGKEVVKFVNWTIKVIQDPVVLKTAGLVIAIIGIIAIATTATVTTLGAAAAPAWIGAVAAISILLTEANITHLSAPTAMSIKRLNDGQSYEVSVDGAVVGYIEGHDHDNIYTIDKISIKIAGAPTVLWDQGTLSIDRKDTPINPRFIDDDSDENVAGLLK